MGHLDSNFDCFNYFSVPIISERFLNSLLNFKADRGNDDSIVLIDCLNGSINHGVHAASTPSPAPTLNEVFDAVGVQRSDIEALIAAGFVDPDAIDMLYGNDDTLNGSDSSEYPVNPSISPFGGGMSRDFSVS